MFELGRRFNQRLGAARLDGPRWCYPLALHLARDYVAARVALIGDAAHVVHPIAGLGLNLGLRDVAALAEIILNAVRLGLDFGNAQHLAQYQSWRRFDNAAVGLMCDALNRLFSNDIAAVRLVRDFGLGLVNNIAPIKQFFAREATGHDGDVPKLLRGEPI